MPTLFSCCVIKAIVIVFSVRRTQCTSWSVMFKNRVQIGRLSGVDSLVGNAGDLEFDALVNGKPKVMFEQSRCVGRLTVGATGDYPDDDVLLCTLETSDVYHLYADQNKAQNVDFHCLSFDVLGSRSPPNGDHKFG